MRYLAATARPILLDLAGTIAFYALYVATGSARFGAAVGLLLGLTQLANALRKRQRPPGLLLVSLALTLGLGGLTLVTRDPRFLLLKPSIICVAVGAAMLSRGWVTEYVPRIGRELLGDATFHRVGWTWSGLLFLSAAVNVACVAALPSRTAAEIFGAWAIGSKLCLFALQYTVLRLRAGKVYRSRAAQGSLTPELQALAESA